jgi:hypothetical protein
MREIAPQHGMFFLLTVAASRRTFLLSMDV